ncbi:MAG: GlmU family protein [Saprospiraceae bacterium]|jgi:UDP-N-acetylglucosamine diphosphorylase/glucosamine-1-phosphate N-acetyltransferase|nr:GlmU family protein [Saprospiraceae bacterium]MBL0026930.1 GlmU family protein [Saprospiraceae bacterium]
MKAGFPENIILFGDDHWFDLLPLTFTRPICELRVGILTIREKWEKYLHGRGSFITQDYLAGKFPIQIENDNILINSTFLPEKQLVNYIFQLRQSEALLLGPELIAARMSSAQFQSLSEGKDELQNLKGIDLSNEKGLEFRRITKPYHIFLHNGHEIIQDFQLITEGKKSESISGTNRIFGKYPVFLEEGASMECSIINAHDGPVYIGKKTKIMEGVMIRGSFAACENVVVKMGAKIYGPTTAGPGCTIGGEIKNSVLLANSNKSHDGFLGNSVIGEWCNLGADTNTSNLKNNYLPVKIWSYLNERFEDTGLQFCGLIMGDHSKSGINTMFNTGSVVGVASNIFGDGFPRTFIPSFSWGGASGFTSHTLNKATETAEIVLARRKMEFSEEDKKIFEHIFLNTARHRVS